LCLTLNVFYEKEDILWKRGTKAYALGRKKALKLEDIWRIRIRLELEERLEELALFNLAVDGKCQVKLA